jgi:hypothetical protein
MPKNRVCATAKGLPKFTRRAFVRATAATPLAALPVAGFAQPEHDDEDMLDFLIALANHTGLTFDDLHSWFSGISSEVVGRVVVNARAASLPRWNKETTHSAVIGFKASETFAKTKSPLATYCDRQIRIRADMDEVRAVLSNFSTSAQAFPSLMDLVG